MCEDRGVGDSRLRKSEVIKCVLTLEHRVMVIGDRIPKMVDDRPGEIIIVDGVNVVSNRRFVCTFGGEGGVSVKASIRHLAKGPSGIVWLRLELIHLRMRKGVLVERIVSSFVHAVAGCNMKGEMAVWRSAGRREQAN